MHPPVSAATMYYQQNVHGTHTRKKTKGVPGTAVVLTRAAVIEERFPVLPLLEKKNQEKTSKFPKSGKPGTLAFLF